MLIAVMYTSSSRACDFYVLTYKLVSTRLSYEGIIMHLYMLISHSKCPSAVNCLILNLCRNHVDLQQHTPADYDGTNLLMPSGNMSF